MYMTSSRKGFYEVSDYVKKLEGVMQVGEAKMLSKKSQNVRILVDLSLRDMVSRPT